MVKFHLLIFLILGLTVQTCIKGCLKCTTDNKCIFCDTTTNYKLENDSCSLVDQPNCSIINISGDCQLCENNYWMNTTTKKCVIIETEKKVENCFNYTSSQTCMQCEPHFIIEAAKCKAVTQKLTNCDFYKSETLCSKCAKGYFVSSDEKSCEKLPTISNCAYLSRFQCESCSTGFILNKNLYFKNSFKTSSNLEKEETLVNIQLNKSGTKKIANRSLCQKITAQFCSVYETFNLCKTCITGYFLKEDKSCEKFPEILIPNCEIYSSNTTCTKCDKGFYLSSSTQCKTLANVENCIIYSQTSNKTQCTQCNSEYYLTSAISCSLRNISAQNKIANCVSESVNSDKCEICYPHLVLSNSGDECALKLANCLEHNSFTTGNTPTCSECMNGFYLDNNICRPGTDTNCEKFTTGGNCSKCKNKFFHNANAVCEAHSANSYCLTYSDSTKNSCVKCINKTFNFLIANRCKVLPSINNCVTYNHLSNATTAKCATCKKWYYESTDGLSCNFIPIANCSKVNNTDPLICTECSSSYNLFVFAGPITECRNPHEYLTEKCNTFTNPGTNRINASVCNDCKTGALTVDYENNYACINNDYLKENSIGIISPIAGCLKYNGTNCEMCEGGKFLQNDQASCLDDCGSSTSISPIKTTVNGNNNFVSLYNYCSSTSENKIKLEGANVLASGNITISCVSNHMPVVDTILTVTDKKNYSNISLDGTFGNYVQDIGTVNIELASCTDFTAGKKLVDDSTSLTDKCKFYKETATDTYGCLRCDHGFSAKPHAADSPVLTTGDCSTMASCSNNIYGNIPGYWARFFSCHKCDTADEIPFLFYKFTGAEDITFSTYSQFDLSKATTWTGANANDTLKCLNNEDVSIFKTQIGLPANHSVSKVQFCGLAIFNLTGNIASFDNSKISDANYTGGSTTYCVACKPGYKPNTARDPHTVIACSKIDNCANSTWFNSCSKCNDNYVFNYNANGVDYSTCVSHSKIECFAAADSAVCSLCKKGFSLNADNYCVQINTPKCENNKFTPRLVVDISTKLNDLGYLFWYSEQGAGCNQCNLGFSAVLYSSSNYPKLGCASSNYIVSNSSNFPNDAAGGNSLYINNCSNYQVNENQILCNKCSGNFVLRQDNKECISVLNCVEAVSGSTIACAVCAEGYGLITGGGCVAGNTANCATYFTSTANSTAKCNICNEGFYKTNDNLCLEGSVSHCKVNGNTAKKCITCQDGYFLIQNNLLNGDYDYCYKFDASLNCSAVNISNESNIGAKFNCSACSVGNSVLEAPLDTENKTNCLSFNLIENCDTYNIGVDLVGTSFSCKACDTGFFSSIDGFKCFHRYVNPSGCKTYQSNADLCSVCDDFYFLSANKKECIPFPTGFIGCMTYTNEKKCIACKNKYWLNTGSCLSVESDALVENCLYYSNATTCSICESNYILEGNSCVALNVSNCDTYASKDACEICNSGYRLKSENGKTDCESFSKSNCVLFDQSGTNPCLQCSQNFYINSEGNCEAVTPLIAKCLINLTIDTCKTCSKGFALSIDKKTCVNSSEYDNNCEIVTMPQKMNCSQCNPGFYLKDSQCTAFSGKSISNGCFSEDLENSNICLLCNTGYYMNSSLNCVKNDNPPDNVGGAPDDIYCCFGIILRSLIVMITGFLFVF